jgi:hypothetical protein
MLDHKNAYAGLTFFPVFRYSGIRAFRLLLITVEVPWSTLHLGELLCTFLSYAAPYLVMLHPLSYIAPSELRCTPLSCPAF